MIYLDNNATTPLDPRVLDAMMPFLTTEFGNAASNHTFGKRISRHVESARERVADLLNCDPRELIFSSGATEAINLAIKGIAKSGRTKGNHIITVSTEHSAVLDTCKSLEADGYDVTYLPVRNDGLLDLEVLSEAIRSTTLLICVMLVNNETGIIQPIKEISKIAHKHGILVMTDATQAVGKMPVDVYELGVDLLAFSAHKFYGPKGIGGLFIIRQHPKISLVPLLHGGGHEFGMRSGTLNVPAIVGLGKAAELALVEMSQDMEYIGDLTAYLERILLDEENAFLNGHLTSRLYNTANIGFKGIDANVVIGRLNMLALSNSSACTSAIMEPSHVLRSMGRSNEEAYSSIRFSLGRFTTREDIENAMLMLKPLISGII
jgi:cysteine desulfurase